MYPLSPHLASAPMTLLPQQNSGLFSANEYDTTAMRLDHCLAQDLINQSETAQNYFPNSPPNNPSNSSTLPNSFLETLNLLNQNVLTNQITGMNVMTHMQQHFGAASGSANTLSNKLLHFPMVHSSKPVSDFMQDPTRLITQQMWLSYCNQVKQEQQTNPYHLESKRNRLEVWPDHLVDDEQCPLSANINTTINTDETVRAGSIKFPVVTEQNGSNPQALIPSGSKRRKTSIISSKSSSRWSISTSDPALHPEVRKKIVHILAEKKGRASLKNGFEKLVSAIPVVPEAGFKATNAVVLNRAVQHILDLKAQSEQKEKQINEMKDKIAQFKDNISKIQSNLSSNSHCDNSPKNSAQLMRSQVLKFFERYRREQSKQDSKFLLMSKILQQLVEFYADDIHPEPLEQEKVLLSARSWIAKSWNLTSLRPLASETLLKLATENRPFTELSTSLPEHMTSEGINVSP